MTDREPTVFVAGASGDTGQEICRLLSPRVGTVRVLTSSPEKSQRLHADGADEVVVDNLLDPDDLRSELDGVDTVVSAVGTAPEKTRSPPFVDGAGNRNLLTAAVDAGVESFVMVSALGVGPEPASPLAAAFDVFIGPIQRAKAEAEAAIREASIRHTILRPGVLTGGGRSDSVTVADPGEKLWGAVSRADVARLAVAAPTTEAAKNRTFEVVSTPRHESSALDIDWELPQPDRETIPVRVLE